VKFLETENGDLIAAKAVVRIGPLNTRTHITRRWHEIDYVHGSEAHSTTASEDAVAYFLGSTDKNCMQ
jgi:hypothetical protein